MLTQAMIETTAQQIAAAAHAPLKVILFGSYARGDADTGSDLDFLVVEQDIPDPATEYLRLHRAGSNLEVGVDILLMTDKEFEKKRDWWSTPVYAAVREGKVLYERA
ncbi:MAG: nucleotidyltransferase domain-containing protein [Halochromatium sp.]|uniref:nucleotidyltransferase domain-containing protein n=1 Tax=Halochromatium sp. TaxID=2049430 RepID=UPI0039788A46